MAARTLCVLLVVCASVVVVTEAGGTTFSGTSTFTEDAEVMAAMALDSARDFGESVELVDTAHYDHRGEPPIIPK